MGRQRLLLDRRTMLRSALAGTAALALPPLEAMIGRDGLFHGTAEAASSGGGRKLLVFHTPNGVFLPDWIPKGIGRDWTPSDLLRPLASVRADINVLSGVSNERLRSDAHSSPNDSFLTGTWSRTAKAPTGPSIDTVVADAIGKSSHFPALRISLNSGGSNRSLWFSEQARAIQPIASPNKLYRMVTGQISSSSSSPGAPSFATSFRRSVLDEVKGDLDRLKKRCGVGDRRVLDEYAASIASIEKRLGKLAPVSCEKPTGLAAKLARLPDQPSYQQGLWPNTTHSDNLEERLDVLVELAVLALRCELTRVVVISLGSSNSRQTYPFLHQGNTDDHFYSHLQKDPGSRAKQLEWNQVTKWKVDQLAALIQRLKKPLAGGGTLLGSTVVVAGSELGNGAGHSGDMLPIVVAGNIGPMAAATGRNRHIAAPCSPDAYVFRPPGPSGATLAVKTVKDYNTQICTSRSAYTPMANVWLTALQALGIKQTKFGDSSGTIRGLWV